MCALSLGSDSDNREIRIRVGRHGAYVERNVDDASDAKKSKKDEK